MSDDPRLDHHAHCSYPFCKTPAVIYADRVIPFCRGHAEAVFRHLADHLPGARRSARRVSSATRAAQPDPDRPSIVYYVKVDHDHIKIGYTTSPEQRWARLRDDYGGCALLVAEPGGMSAEVSRQAQFAHLRVGQSELFRIDPLLTAYIERLQAQRPDWRLLVDEVQAVAVGARQERQREARARKAAQKPRKPAALFAPPREGLRRIAH